MAERANRSLPGSNRANGLESEVNAHGFRLKPNGHAPPGDGARNDSFGQNRGGPGIGQTFLIGCISWRLRSVRILPTSSGMNDTRNVMPEEVREKAQAVALAFADEIVSILRQALAGMSDALMGAGTAAPVAAQPAKKGPAKATRRAPAKKAAAPKKAAPAPAAASVAQPPAKGPEANRDLKKRILNTLKKSKEGMGAEQLNRVLGTTSRDLAVPMQEMIAAGQVRKTGMARGTKYFALP